MPRSGWVAAGAVGAALATSLIGPAWVLAVALTALVAIGVAEVVGVRAPARPLILAAIGAVAIGLRLVALPVTATAHGEPDGRGPWTMVVESVGSPRDGKQVATLRTAAASSGGGDFRLAATLPRYPAVEPLDVVVVEGRTRPRPDSPYGRYLERLGAWGTLEADRLEVEPPAADPARMLERLRRAAGDALAGVLPEPEAGLAAGILIGLRDRVDREVAAAFTTAGVSHVVAISGWNIAIVAAAIGTVAGRLGRRRRSVVTAVAIVAYVAFAGASPSVLRAGAMAGVVLLARESGRAGLAATALGWAAAVLLVVDPRLIGDAGFQLSTLATAGLIAWATPMTARCVRWTGGHLPSWVTESLGVSLAAQAATLPIVLASFGRLAVVAPAVNLAIVPLVAPAMAAGIVALVGGAIVGLGGPAVVGAILAVPAWVALRLIVSVVDASTALPFASLELPPAAAVAAGIASAMVLVAVASRGSRPGVGGRPIATSAPVAASSPLERRVVSSRRPRPDRALRFAAMALIASVGMTGMIAVTRPGGGARLSVLDVGQGDAILVEGSRGGRMLVDGGPDPDRLLVALDRRIPPWDRRIDVVILSHPHEDHVAGLAMLLRRFRVGRVLEPGMRGPGPGYDAWAAMLGQLGAPARGTVAAGDRLRVDDIDLDVLWPRAGTVPAEPSDDGTGINNVSVVLAGAVAGRRFLLMGDVEEEVDPVLLTSGLAPVDVLKVAHHGSRTATTQAFVEAIRPAVAIASAGARNRYGHPAPATMERLELAGARVLRTDRDGTVVARFDATGVRVEAEGSRGAVTIGQTVAVASATIPTVPDAAIPAVPLARSGFLCGIPVPRPVSDHADAGGPLTRPTHFGPVGPDGPTRLVGYHRADAQPTALPVRGRRPGGGSPDRAVRRGARRGARDAARALGADGQPEQRGRGCREPARTPRDAGALRWWDARRGPQARGPGPPQRRSRPGAGRDP